jgi:signal transduction histidine kinase
VGYGPDVSRFLALSRFALPGLAAALLVGMVVEFSLLDGAEHRPALIVLAVVTGVALLLQPRSPLAAPLLAIAAVAATAAFAPNAIQDASTPFFVVLLVAWCFGAYNPPRRALVGLLAIDAAVVYVVARFPDHSGGDFVWVASFVTAAWLAGFAVRHQAEQTRRLRELAAQLRAQRDRMAEEAVQAERSRIARELHDVVAHHVSVMTVQAGAVRRLLQAGQEREREALVSVEETGRKALTEMRRLLGVLKDDAAEQPAPLAPQPGVRTLETLLEQVRDAGLPVQLSTEGEPVELPPGIDLSAYRIVQEALTNALKHAGPARAWVVVRYAPDALELEIANDGSTEAAQNGRAGHGLVGMRERVAVYGGELDSGPRPGGGFAVRATLPIGRETT